MAVTKQQLAQWSREFAAKNPDKASGAGSTAQNITTKKSSVTKEQLSQWSREFDKKEAQRQAEQEQNTRDKALQQYTERHISSRPEGALLSDEARKRLENIFTDFGTNIWTRTRSDNVSYHHDSSDNDYYYDGVALSGVNDSYYGRFNTTYGHTQSWGYLPCFTLPETLYIDRDGFPTVNQPPEVTSDVGESGVALAVRENVASGTELTVQCLSEKALFQQILNGENTLVLEADDGKTSVDWTATFTKNVTSAVLSLAQPLTADDTITVAALTLEGSFPSDMSLTVELSNNARDDVPVWENCTDIQSGESRAFVHHAFTNKTAAKGAAFNYKVTITRGASGVGGNITMIGGVIG